MSNIQAVNLILVILLYTLFAQQPNIVFIYVDDVGFNDFGFNQNTQTQTPFIDNLVHTESLQISRNYVSFVCSPTRAQMLSGRYASHLGLQHSIFTQNAPFSLTRQVSLLSNEFQSNGYSTHLIGKYHLGFQAWEYTPTYRGFDTFSGYYNGEETYYSHLAYVKDTDLIYYDLRENEEPDSNTDYSVYRQRDKFLTLLDTVNENDNPFFIYLAFQAAHFPPQAPNEYAALYCDPSGDAAVDINSIKSQLPYLTEDGSDDVYLSGDCSCHDMHMAQMTSIDDAIKLIINRMKELELWQDTLIVFSSDNGAEMNFGDNAPLRGAKGTPFEGGVRVAAFVTGGYLRENRRGETLDEFAVHATDWYPTLLSAAGLELKYERSRRLHGDAVDTKWDYIEEDGIKIVIDGADIWNAIQTGEIDKNLLDREILLHLDETDCPYESCGALLFGDWKYIRGASACDASDDSYKCGWNNAFMTDPQHNVLGCDVLQLSQTDTDGDMSCADGCLFNLKTDPCEMMDVKEENGDIVEIMEDKLLFWQRKSVVPLMGNEETYLDAKEIDPLIVCQSEYWCPYMEYDDVEFEHVLYAQYVRLYGKGDGNEKESGERVAGLNEDMLLRIMTVFTFIALICMFYGKFCKKYTTNDIKEIHRESSPLL